MGCYWVTEDRPAMVTWLAACDAWFNDTMGEPEECPTIPGLYRFDIAVQLGGVKLADAVPLPNDAGATEVKWLYYDDPTWTPPPPGM